MIGSRSWFNNTWPFYNKRRMDATFVQIPFDTSKRTITVKKTRVGSTFCMGSVV